MTVHPVRPDDAVTLRPNQEHPDSNTTSAYDSTWTEQPATQSPDALEQVMLPDGKIYVVLAVVLIIWAGLIALMVRTDRKIDRLERRLDDTGSEDTER
jgi:hypothetical protein